jgi:hypothetical protein
MTTFLLEQNFTDKEYINIKTPFQSDSEKVFFIVKRKPPALPVVPKSFSYAKKASVKGSSQFRGSEK